MNEPIAEGTVILMVGGVVVYVTDSEREERIAPYRQTIQQIKTPGRNRGSFLRGRALLLLATLLAALSGLLPRLLLLNTKSAQQK